MVAGEKEEATVISQLPRMMVMLQLGRPQSSVSVNASSVSLRG